MAGRRKLWPRAHTTTTTTTTPPAARRLLTPRLCGTRPSALFGGGSNPRAAAATQKNWLESAAAALFSSSPSSSIKPGAAAAAADADPAFSEWLRGELGVAAQQPTVLVERDGAGRGLVAARPIAKNELVAFIPAECAITAAVAARESPLLRRQRAAAAAAAGGSSGGTEDGGGGGLAPDLPDWTALAVWLADQKHALEEQEAQRRQQEGQKIDGGKGAAPTPGQPPTTPLPPPTTPPLPPPPPTTRRWAPYIARLPAWGAMGTVLEWYPSSGSSGSSREEQVARDLAGSGLRHKAAEILRAADATWREVERAAAAGGSAGEGADGEGGPYTRARLEWALAVLLSRVVRLDGAPGAPSALVPWCDYLNHSPAAACYLDLVSQGAGAGAGGGGGGAAVVGVRADRAYERGEEVFISYGPKSSGELLLSYGFSPPPSENAANDVAFIQIAIGGGGGGGGGGGFANNAGGMQPPPPLPPQVMQMQQMQQIQHQHQERAVQAKRRALARRGIPAAETFALRADALPEGLLEYVAFADAEVDDGGDGDGDGAVEALASAIFDGSGGGGVGGGAGRAAWAPQTGTGLLPRADLEAVAWRGVAARCRQALADYATDEAADRELAASAPSVRERGASAADPAERRALLAEVRLRERRILAAAMFAATAAGKAQRRRR